MRNVFVAGVALAAAVLAANYAIHLLDVANDWYVLAGYLVLLALVTALSGALYRIWRRL